MLSAKYNGRIRFLKDTPSPGAALPKVKVQGTILTASANWYRTDKAVTCEAELLVTDSSEKPWQVNLAFDGKNWSVSEKNVSAELGAMKEETAFAKKQKFITEDEALDIANEQNPVKKAMRRAPHLLIISSNFTIFDDSFGAPTWRFSLKNWPLINYLGVKNEESRTVDVIVDAAKKRILGCREYQ